MPKTPDRHDLVVIGGGSAGLVAADFGARFGADVLLVERDRFGGDCTWTGCVPSKALLHEAAVALRLRSRGLDVDFAEVVARVHAAIQRVHSFETPEKLAERGIRTLHGSARFLDSRTIEVDGRRIHGSRYVVCTGAGPQLPPIPGLDRLRPITYERVFDLEHLPRRLTVMGGGPIGVELAQAFRRLGSEVTVLERAGRLLPAADAEAADMLLRRLQAEGVRIVTGAEPTEAELGEADVLLVATGRVPGLNGLDLDRAGVRSNERGIEVDDRLRTSQAHIYAAGDVTGSFQFTHYAGWQGYVAARNALFPGSVRGLAGTVPWAVFTHPEIAQVGLIEEDARARGLAFEVLRMPLDRIDRAQTLGETEGFIKIIATESGRLLGATVVAPEAAEVANELSVALATGVDLSGLARTMHVYPTIGFGVQQLASEFALKQAAHGFAGRLARLLVRGRECPSSGS